MNVPLCLHQLYLSSTFRYMVGIAGVPGSGKSTTAHAVCAKINSMRPRLDKRHVAVVVSMDGTSMPLKSVPADQLAITLADKRR